MVTWLIRNRLTSFKIFVIYIFHEEGSTIALKILLIVYLFLLNNTLELGDLLVPKISFWPLDGEMAKGKVLDYLILVILGTYNFRVAMWKMYSISLRYDLILVYKALGLFELRDYKTYY